MADPASFDQEKVFRKGSRSRSVHRSTGSRPTSVRRSIHTILKSLGQSKRKTPDGTSLLRDDKVQSGCKITRNPFINFLRDFRRNVSRKPAWLTAVIGAKVWNGLDMETKVRYQNIAKEAPKMVYRKRPKKKMPRRRRHRERRHHAKKHRHHKKQN